PDVDADADSTLARLDMDDGGCAAAAPAGAFTRRKAARTDAASAGARAARWVAAAAGPVGAEETGAVEGSIFDAGGEASAARPAESASGDAGRKASAAATAVVRLWSPPR
ncbi:unnamed protein product, partial [Phaeothamnion confervicola]